MTNTYRAAVGGFLLPLAMFILVILALLSGYAMRLSVFGNHSSSQDILGTRAYWAAKAGADWGAYQIYRPDNAVGHQLCFGTTTLSNINNFNVQVSCRMLSRDPSIAPEIDNGNQEIRVFEITAQATQGTKNNVDYVERDVKLTFARCIELIPGGNVECS